MKAKIETKVEPEKNEVTPTASSNESSVETELERLKKELSEQKAKYNSLKASADNAEKNLKIKVKTADAGGNSKTSIDKKSADSKEQNALNMIKAAESNLKERDLLKKPQTLEFNAK